MRPTSIGSRVINLPTIQKGEAMSATEVAHRLRITTEQAGNALRHLVGKGMMQKGRRDSGSIEYWMVKSGESAVVLSMPWLRPTGMMLSQACREGKAFVFFSYGG